MAVINAWTFAIFKEAELRETGRRGRIRQIIAFRCTSPRTAARIYTRRIGKLNWQETESTSNRTEQTSAEIMTQRLCSRLLTSRFYWEGSARLKRNYVGERLQKPERDYQRNMKADKSVSILSRINPVRIYVFWLKGMSMWSRDSSARSASLVWAELHGWSCGTCMRRHLIYLINYGWYNGC